MQDFVRIGVADPGEQVRIGQRTLCGVVFGLQASRELGQACPQTSSPPGSIPASALSPATRW
jgi:hypothetical protein